MMLLSLSHGAAVCVIDHSHNAFLVSLRAHRAVRRNLGRWLWLQQCQRSWPHVRVLLLRSCPPPITSTFFSDFFIDHTCLLVTIAARCNIRGPILLPATLVYSRLILVAVNVVVLTGGALTSRHHRKSRLKLIFALLRFGSRLGLLNLRVGID